MRVIAGHENQTKQKKFNSFINIFNNNKKKRKKMTKINIRMCN